LKNLNIYFVSDHATAVPTFMKKWTVLFIPFGNFQNLTGGKDYCKPVFPKLCAAEEAEV